MDRPKIADKEEAILALKTLTQQLGWYVLMDFLEENTGEMAKGLLDPANGLSEEDKKLLTLKRHLQLKLLSIPSSLIKKYENEDPGVVHNPMNVDPYEVI